MACTIRRSSHLFQSMHQMEPHTMDSRSFDALTRAMATGSSRPTVLRGLVGGLATALGVAAGEGTVSAKTAAQKAAKKAAKLCAGQPDGASCGSPGSVCCGGSCRDAASFQSD